MCSSFSSKSLSFFWGTTRDNKCQTSMEISWSGGGKRRFYDSFAWIDYLYLTTQVRPSIPVTTNTQTCQCPPTVQLACPPSIPHSYRRSPAVGSTATPARCRPVAPQQQQRHTRPSHPWYQTSTTHRPNWAPLARTAPRRFTSPTRAKTPTFPP